MAENPFAVNVFDKPLVDEPKPYSHGYSHQEVEEIKAKKKMLEARLLANGSPVTLEEFKTIVVPHIRIHRTEEFIFKPDKPVKPKKEPVIREAKQPKAPKAPKITKKQELQVLQQLMFKLAQGGKLTPEEQVFFDKQTGAA